MLRPEYIEYSIHSLPHGRLKSYKKATNNLILKISLFVFRVLILIAIGLLLYSLGLVIHGFLNQFAANIVNSIFRNLLNLGG
jgi:uncharacterized membrane protein YoaK (UPF0700 family)